jgi:hypothetical protein
MPNASAITMARKVRRFTGNQSLAGAGVTRSGRLLRHLPLPCRIRPYSGRCAWAAQGPRSCENAKTLDRDRTSYSFGAFLSGHTASLLKFSLELENIILAVLRASEFSHDLGQ